jgi:bacteriorhodopsin
MKILKSNLFWILGATLVVGLLFYFLVRYASGASQLELTEIATVVFFLGFVFIAIAYAVGRNNINVESDQDAETVRIHSTKRCETFYFYGDQYFWSF